MTDELEAQVEEVPASPDLSKKVEELEAEVHRLRETNREETARRLGTTHHLPDPVVELLKTVPRDQMEAKAQAIADAMPKSQGQPAATQEPAAPADPAPPEVADAQALKALQQGGEGGVVVQAKTVDEKDEEAVKNAPDEAAFYGYIAERQRAALSGE
jgi:hypothetical protein